VRGEVVRTQVSLDLDDAAPQLPAVHLPNQHFAEEVSRDGHRLAIEEPGLEDLARRRGRRG
jgi:hypothetical protein